MEKKFKIIILITFITSFSVTTGFLIWSIYDYYTFQIYVDTYSPVYQGVGVNKASNYTNESGIHPIVLLGPDGTRHKWTTEIPSSWRPKSISDVELVICIYGERGRGIESCPYELPSGGIFYITTVQLILDANLREAKTGRSITNITIEGPMPRHCGAIEYIDNDDTIYGSHVSFTQLIEELIPYIII